MSDFLRTGLTVEPLHASVIAKKFIISASSSPLGSDIRNITAYDKTNRI